MDFFREYYISGKALSTEAATETQSTPTPTEVTPSPKPDTEPSLFKAELNSEHNFILLVPMQGVDQEKLMDAIEEHNNQADPEGKLKIERNNFV